MRGLKVAVLTAFILVATSSTGYLLTRPDPVASLTYPRGDFLTFYWAGRTVLEGESPRFVDAHANANSQVIREYTDAPVKIGAYLYPPTANLYLMPLGWAGEATSQTLYLMGMGLMAIIFCGICGYITGFPVIGTILCFLWAVMSLHANLVEASLHPYLSVLLAASVLLLLRGDHEVPGVLMGVVACVKPVEWLYWWPMLVVHHRGWRTLPWTGGVVIASVLVSLLLWGFTPWEVWVTKTVPGTVTQRAMSFDRAYLLGASIWLALGIRSVWHLQARPEDLEQPV